MSDRATRPLNQDAVSAADDDLYSKHADDPRPNALYDEDGNRKPLSATDPDQADLRKEWMDSYKANGGETEPDDVSGSDPSQPMDDCGTQQQVDPVITGDEVEYDDSDVPAPPEESEDDEPEPEEEPEEPAPDDQPEEEPPADDGEVIAVNERLKQAPPDADGQVADDGGDSTPAADDGAVASNTDGGDSGTGAGDSDSPAGASGDAGDSGTGDPDPGNSDSQAVASNDSSSDSNTGDPDAGSSDDGGGSEEPA